MRLIILILMLLVITACTTAPVQQIEQEFTSAVVKIDESIVVQYTPLNTTSQKYIMFYKVYQDKDMIADTVDGFEGVNPLQPIRVTLDYLGFNSTYIVKAVIQNNQENILYNDTIVINN